MEYHKLKRAVSDAWAFGFYEILAERGFTDEQLDRLEVLLNQKDVFNSVMDCVVGVDHE